MPLKIQQGLAFPYHNVLDFGDEDRVIARILGRMQSALQIGQRAVQHWRAVGGAVKSRPHFFCLTATGFHESEVLGNFALVRRQNINSKAFLEMNVSMRPGFMIHTHQDQQRIERYRAKCVRGHALNCVLVIDCDDCHSGRKTSHCLAKLRLCNAHSAKLLSGEIVPLYS